MDDAADVGRPGCGGRVLRTCDEELHVRLKARGFVKEVQEACLTIGSIGAEIAEVGAELLLRLHWQIDLGIDRAIKGAGTFDAEGGLEGAEGGAAGEAEIGGELGHEAWVEVVCGTAIAELRHGDGGVDIVKEDALAATIEQLASEADGVGEEGADDDDVGVGAEVEQGTAFD